MKSGRNRTEKDAVHDQEQDFLRLLREAEASGVSDRQVPDIMAEVKQRLRADGRL